MEKLQQLIKEATIITYGEQGALRRQQLIETDRVQYHILLSEGNLYERIQQAEPEGRAERNNRVYYPNMVTACQEYRIYSR